MSLPRTKEEIQAKFQQNRYDAGWLDYRIKNSLKQLDAMDKECEALLAEAEQREKLDAEAKAENVPHETVEAVEVSPSGAV